MHSHGSLIPSTLPRVSFCVSIRWKCLDATLSEHKVFKLFRSDWSDPQPHDPTRPMVTLKTSWNNARKKAKVQGRWHDNRHTLVTDLAESGAGDETIRDIAGHVSKQILKHYSHIRMEAKRKALESIVPKPDLKKSGNADSVPGEPAAQTVGGARTANGHSCQLTASARIGRPVLTSAFSLRLL